MARTVGSFGEFFSDMLGTHVKKGIAERAHLGLHLGGIPFGYQPCWERVDGERRRTCRPEHPSNYPGRRQGFNRYFMDVVKGRK